MLQGSIGVPAFFEYFLWLRWRALVERMFNFHSRAVKFNTKIKSIDGWFRLRHILFTYKHVDNYRFADPRIENYSIPRNNIFMNISRSFIFANLALSIFLQVDKTCCDTNHLIVELIIELNLPNVSSFFWTWVCKHFLSLELNNFLLKKRRFFKLYIIISLYFHVYGHWDWRVSSSAERDDGSWEYFVALSSIDSVAKVRCSKPNVLVRSYECPSIETNDWWTNQRSINAI